MTRLGGGLAVQILVFCCAHAAQVQAHLEAGLWLKPGARCKVLARCLTLLTTCSVRGVDGEQS